MQNLCWNLEKNKKLLMFHFKFYQTFNQKLKKNLTEKNIFYQKNLFYQKNYC